MALHTDEEILEEERRYFRIFLLLGVLTLLEIGATFLPIAHAVIVLALVVLAVVKATLVAAFYMHLSTEKTTLKWIAVTPMILCVFLLFMLTPDLGAFTRLVTHALAGAENAAEHAEH